MKLNVDLLIDFISEVDSFILIPNKVLKEHDDVNAVLVVLHFFSKSFELLVSESGV